MKPVNVLVSGVLGRMGRSVIECIEQSPKQYVVGGLLVKPSQLGEVDQLIKQHQLPAAPVLEKIDKQSDVLIDFTLPEGTLAYLPWCVEHQIPIVVGTTGFSSDQFQAIQEAAKHIPILYSANMSVGINVLSQLLKKAAPMLLDSFDIEIVETHHRAKRDAPSGTALLLGESIARATGLDMDQSSVYGRSGSDCIRQPKTIGFSAIRGGDVVGEHAILFLGEGEKICLSHQATDRLLFARGALFAGSWLVNQATPGLYGLGDALSAK